MSLGYLDQTGSRKSDGRLENCPRAQFVATLRESLLREPGCALRVKGDAVSAIGLVPADELRLLGRQSAQRDAGRARQVLSVSFLEEHHRRRSSATGPTITP